MVGLAAPGRSTIKVINIRSITTQQSASCRKWTCRRWVTSVMAVRTITSPCFLRFAQANPSVRRFVCHGLGDLTTALLSLAFALRIRGFFFIRKILLWV
jgi:hypothetical protein